MSDKVKELLQAQNLSTKTLYQYKLYHLKYITWFNEKYRSNEDGKTNRHNREESIENINYTNVQIDSFKICLFLIHYIGEEKRLNTESTIEILNKIVSSLKILYKILVITNLDNEQGKSLNIKSIPNIPDSSIIDSFLSYINLITHESSSSSSSSSQQNDNKTTLIDKFSVNFYNDNTVLLNKMKSSLFRTSLEKMKFYIDFIVQYYTNLNLSQRQEIQLDHFEIIEPSNKKLSVVNDLVLNLPIETQSAKILTLLPSIPTNLFVCPTSSFSIYMFLRVYGSIGYAGDLKKHYVHNNETNGTTENGTTKDRGTLKKTAKTQIDFSLIRGRFMNKSISPDTLGYYYQAGFHYLREPYKKNLFFNKKFSSSSSSSSNFENNSSLTPSSKPVIIDPFSVPNELKDTNSANNTPSTKTLSKSLPGSITSFWNIQGFEFSDKSQNQDQVEMIDYILSSFHNKDSGDLQFMQKQWDSLPKSLHEPIFNYFKVLALTSQNDKEVNFWTILGKQVLLFLPILYKFFPNHDIFKSNKNTFVSKEYQAYYQRTWKAYTSDEQGVKIWNNYLHLMQNLIEDYTNISAIPGLESDKPSKVENGKPSSTTEPAARDNIEVLVKQLVNKELNSRNINLDPELHAGLLDEGQDDDSGEEEEEEEKLKELIDTYIKKEFKVFKNTLVAEIKSSLMSELKEPLLLAMREEMQKEFKARDVAMKSQTSEIPAKIEVPVVESQIQIAKRDNPERVTKQQFSSPSRSLKLASSTSPVSILPQKRRVVDEVPKKANTFVLNPNIQLPIADIVCEWYAPDVDQDNKSVHLMNKEYNSSWRETDPNKSLYKLRKPIIEVYWKTFTALNKKATTNDGGGVDNKLETLKIMNKFCETKCDNDITKLSNYLKSYLKAWKAKNSDDSEWVLK